MGSDRLAIPYSLYNKDDVLLASLIPDKNYPHQDRIAHVDVQCSIDYSITTDYNIIRHLETGSTVSFKTALTRLFSADGNFNDSTIYDITADKALIYELRQPTEMFARLCEQDTVRTWLQKRHRWGKPSYFIVGYVTLIDSKLKCRHEQSSRASAGMVVPIVTAVGAQPLTLALDAEVSVGAGSGIARGEHLTPHGERIYAICYRRVRLSFYRRLSSRNPNVSGNVWKSTLARRNGGKDEFVDANLDEAETEYVGAFNSDMVESMSQSPETDV